MSLEFEGKGDVCVECGVFDFLPSTCPRCGGTFCRDHAYEHHLRRPDDSGAEERPLCKPNYEASGAVAGAAPATASPSSITAGTGGKDAVLCSVCRSSRCVLTPCPACGLNFCVEHRFHAHADGTGIDGVARTVVDASRRVAAARGHAVPEKGVGAVCAPYIKQHPLTLAPPAYRSRCMELTALVCRRQPTHPSDGASSSAASSSWEMGVCSLSVAVEASVGQMVQRCIRELRLVGDGSNPASSPAVSMDDPQLEALSARSCPLKMTASCAPLGEGSDGKARGGASSALALALRPISLSATTKDALLPGELFVLRVDTDVDGDSTASCALAPYLSRLLMAQSPRGSDGSAPAAEHTHVVTDDRVRAAVLRLRLYAGGAPPPSADIDSIGGAGADGREQKEEAGERPATGQSSAPGPAVEAATAAEAGALESPVPSNHTAGAERRGAAEGAAGVAAPWPFRRPAPMTAFPFHNTKMSPLGAKQAAAQAAGGRVLVAVFVQDADLSGVAPVPPFVVALGKLWPVGKVIERVREEAVALAPRAAVSAGTQRTNPQILQEYGVFRLGSASPSSQGQSTALPLQPPAGSSAAPATLQDGDVLFLGTAAAIAPGSPLLTEVERMRGVKGKELAAQRLAMMKQCVVM